MLSAAGGAWRAEIMKLFEDYDFLLLDSSMIIDTM
jgi:hypothetical protein